MSTSVPGVSVSQSSHSPLIRKVGIYDLCAVNLGGGENPPHSIGDRLQIGERVFYFARNSSTALSPGKMCQGAAPSSSYLNCVAYAAAAKGALSIQITLGASVTANYFNGGYVHVNTGTTTWTARVRSHPASGTVGTTSNVCTFKLFDPVPVALTTSSYLTFTKNLWDLPVVVPAAALTQIPIGVPLITITASNTTGGTYSQGIDYYGWLQTWGPCTLLGVGTLVIANNCAIGGTSDGAAGPNIASVTIPPWGQVMRVNATTTYSLVNLRLFP